MTACALSWMVNGCSRAKRTDVLEQTPRQEASAPMAEPSFQADILPVLQRDCADAKGCHGLDPTESIAMDLRPPTAFQELVGVPAKGRPSSLRVLPGHPEKSFLVDKLTAKLRSGEGKAMPLDPDTGVPILPSPLPLGFVDGILRPWIAAGAPDN